MTFEVSNSTRHVITCTASEGLRQCAASFGAAVHPVHPTRSAGMFGSGCRDWRLGCLALVGEVGGNGNRGVLGWLCNELSVFRDVSHGLVTMTDHEESRVYASIITGGIVLVQRV